MINRYILYFIAGTISCLGGLLTYYGIIFSPLIVGEHHLWPNFFSCLVYTVFAPLFTFVLVHKNYLSRKHLISWVFAGALYLSISNIFLYFFCKRSNSVQRLTI